MTVSRKPSTLVLCGLSVCLLLGACRAERAVEGPRSAPSRPVTPPSEPTGLYGLEEALRDVLSGPLDHIGTGSWPGNGRMQACAFRNDRVLVVNVYCGIRDTPAFRLEVYSPTRGRVRIYAESKAPVSGHMRQDYFSFSAESEPPAQRASALPRLDLSMSFTALSAYEEARDAAYLPACYGGMERQTERSGCLGALAPQAATWRRQNDAFLQRASDDWYRAVRALRAEALRFGKDPR